MTGLSKLVLRGELEGAAVVAVEVLDSKIGQLCYLVNRQDPLCRAETDHGRLPAHPRYGFHTLLY
jgi:hypothetical protein